MICYYTSNSAIICNSTTFLPLFDVVGWRPIWDYTRQTSKEHGGGSKRRKYRGKSEGIFVHDPTRETLSSTAVAVSVTATQWTVVGRTTLIRDFAVVSALDLRSDTDERTPESILGRGEQHLLLNLGVIWGPVHITRRHQHTRYRRTAEWQAHQEKNVILFRLPAPSFSYSKSYTAQRGSASGRSARKSS